MPVLLLRAPERGDYLYDVEVMLTLGPLRTSWSLGPFEIARGESLEIPVPVEADAWLHVFAESYVTLLTVHVSVEDESTYRYGMLTPPDLFVGWPDGARGLPAAWTRADVDLYAPHGVTDLALQAEADEIGPDVWMKPPIPRARRASPTRPDRTVDEEVAPGVEEVE